MSDDAHDAPTPETPHSAAAWASPGQEAAAAPADATPTGDRARDAWPEGAEPAEGRTPKVPLDKPAAEPRPEPNPWAAPEDRTPSRESAPPTSASTPGPVHDQPTVTSIPGAGAPAAPGPATPDPRPWDAPFTPQPPSGPGNPFAPSASGNPFAPPAARTPYPQPGPGEPVPPPPIAPDGPGQVPYGYGHPQFAPAPAQGAYQGVPGYGWGPPIMPLMPSNGMGTAGLVLGIIAAVVFCLWPLAIVLGILAVIFGVIGRGKARRGEATNPGQALAGIICGAVGIGLGIAVLVFLIVAPDDSGNDGSSDDGGFSTSLVLQHLR